MVQETHPVGTRHQRSGAAVIERGEVFDHPSVVQQRLLNHPRQINQPQDDAAVGVAR